MHETQDLLGELGGAAPLQKTVSKKGFAELLGVSPGRVSQMITAGLPVEPNGRINVAEGRMWVADNVDSNRQRSNGGSGHFSAKGMRDHAEARIAEMKAERMAGALVDRAEVERVVFGRARAERDAWQQWPPRIAHELAAELKLEEAAVLPILQRLVREHLAQLAETPHADLGR